MRDTLRNFRRWIQGVSAAFHVLLFCSLGFYIFYSADDYIFRFLFREKGPWQSLVFYYMTWSGRFANTFLLLVAAETRLVLLPGMTAALNLIFLYMLLSETVVSLSRTAKITMALLFQAAWFSCVPSLNETFYWFSGMPYTWAATFSLLSLAMLIHVLRTGKRGVVFCLLLLSIFFNGTILEPTCVMQIVILFLLTLHFLFHKKYFPAQTVSVALLIAVAGFLVFLR
jgi:hypothetical protein